MKIERIHEFELSKADEESIAKLLDRGFLEDFGGRSFHQQRHHVRLVVRDNDAIIGHMAVCYRAVRLSGELTTICGLAEVVTAPEARGKGIATAMLTEAIAFAKTTTATYFVLFGNRPIYAANGFVRQTNIVTHVVLDHAQTGSVKVGPEEELMVLPLKDQTWGSTAPLDLIGHKF